MNILCWNCRGLGNPRTVHELTKLVKCYKPLMLFLCETKRKSSDMERLRVTWGFDCCMAVDAIGKGGGLALLWMHEARVEVLSYSNNHIDSKVGYPTRSRKWRFTGFYGFPSTRDRWKSWKLLRKLDEFDSFPWLCVGDFN